MIKDRFLKFLLTLSGNYEPLREAIDSGDDEKIAEVLRGEVCQFRCGKHADEWLAEYEQLDKPD
jgi:hypothetical protein